MGDSVRGIVRAFLGWMAAEPRYARFYSTYAGGNVVTDAARRSDALRVTHAIAEVLTAEHAAPEIDRRTCIAAVTTEVLFRELCLASATGRHTPEAIGIAGDELALRIVRIAGGER